jgi:hypothetical protein
MLDTRWAMTCEYGLQRTGRTLSIDLRIRCSRIGLAFDRGAAAQRPIMSVGPRCGGGQVADRPNILFFHVDNLGFGELSCYSGGPFRAP